MARLTRVKDRYECRIDGCFAEEWMQSLYDASTYEDTCKECPFMKYINKLAEYEDREEVRCHKALLQVLSTRDLRKVDKAEYMRVAMHSLKDEFDHDLIEQEVDKLLSMKGEYEY